MKLSLCGFFLQTFKPPLSHPTPQNTLREARNLRNLNNFLCGFFLSWFLCAFWIPCFNLVGFSKVEKLLSDFSKVVLVKTEEEMVLIRIKIISRCTNDFFHLYKSFCYRSWLNLCKLICLVLIIIKSSSQIHIHNDLTFVVTFHYGQNNLPVENLCCTVQ